MSTHELRRFNSKLVRLEVQNILSLSSLKNSFNSKLVRLEAECLTIIMTSVLSFNSKLVRLEVPISYRPVCEGAVSIPNWCD